MRTQEKFAQTEQIGRLIWRRGKKFCNYLPTGAITCKNLGNHGWTGMDTDHGQRVESCRLPVAGLERAGVRVHGAKEVGGGSFLGPRVFSRCFS